MIFVSLSKKVSLTDFEIWQNSVCVWELVLLALIGIMSVH